MRLHHLVDQAGEDIGLVLVSDKYGPMAARVGAETFALHGGTPNWRDAPGGRDVIILDSRGPLGELEATIGDEL